MHVLKTEPVIRELRVPIRRFGLLLHMRRVKVLWGDTPGGWNIPPDEVGRWVWTLGMCVGHACRGPSVHPPAILPLLWIHSGGSRWYEGVVGSRVVPCRSRGILCRRDDGGRGPG